MEVVPLATPPKKEERRVDTSHRANFGTFDSVAGVVKKPVNRFMMIGVAAVLVIAAAATFAVLKMQKSGASPQQHPLEAANVPPPAAAAPGTVQPTAPTGTVASPTVSNVSATPVASVVPNRAASDSESVKRSAATHQPDKPASVEKPTPMVATLNNATQSRIAQNTAPPQVPDAAPSFAVSNSGSMPAPLTTLAQPMAASTPSAASVSQSQLEPLQLIRTGVLPYPPIAKARHISGQVRVEVTVGKDGKVSNVKLLSGPAIFKDAAFEAVQRYQFKPAKLNGQPIEQTTQILLNFHE